MDSVVERRRVAGEAPLLAKPEDCNKPLGPHPPDARRSALSLDGSVLVIWCEYCGMKNVQRIVREVY